MENSSQFFNAFVQSELGMFCCAIGSSNCLNIHHFTTHCTSCDWSIHEYCIHIFSNIYCNGNCRVYSVIFTFLKKKELVCQSDTLQDCSWYSVNFNDIGAGWKHSYYCSLLFLPPLLGNPESKSREILSKSKMSSGQLFIKVYRYMSCKEYKALFLFQSKSV